jgi:hypothetical protein
MNIMQISATFRCLRRTSAKSEEREFRETPHDRNSSFLPYLDDLEQFPHSMSRYLRRELSDAF